MSAAYFIVLEKQIDGLDLSMDGKSISHRIDDLDAVAHELGVRPLSEFVSISADAANEILQDEDIDEGESELPSLQQFTAEEGLKTVRALAAHSVGRTGGVAQDLRECERILSATGQHGVRWHFEVDI
jgi:hypothetical protein